MNMNPTQKLNAYSHTFRGCSPEAEQQKTLYGLRAGFVVSQG